MDAIHEINAAKTEFREAYNTGDVQLLLSLFHDSVVNMSETFPSAFASGAKAQLRERAAALFARYSVRLVPIVIDIVPCGEKMFDYGWHEFTLSPKSGGPPVRIRQRYMELWEKDSAGNWKIRFYMNNQDIRNEFNGCFAHWFLSEDFASQSSSHPAA